MRLYRSSKAANSPNPVPKPRKRLFKTAKDSYLFKTAREQKKTENMLPDMITPLKMAIDKLSKDHNDNKDKILTSITENINETKVIKGLLTDLRTRIEGMEEKIRDLEMDLAFERDKRIDMEHELENICKREQWERVSRTMVVTETILTTRVCKNPGRWYLLCLLSTSLR